MLQQLKSGFKKTIIWNKYQSDPKIYARNKYLNHLIDSSFQGANILFVLSFENENGRTSLSEYYLPKIEIKDYNVKINGSNLFGKLINNDKITYGIIRKIATGQRDDYAAGCLLDYPFLRITIK